VVLVKLGTAVVPTSTTTLRVRLDVGLALSCMLLSHCATTRDVWPSVINSWYKQLHKLQHFLRLLLTVCHTNHDSQQLPTATQTEALNCAPKFCDCNSDAIS
jgi:hypothetical protein